MQVLPKRISRAYSASRVCVIRTYPRRYLHEQEEAKGERLVSDAMNTYVFVGFAV